MEPGQYVAIDPRTGLAATLIKAAGRAASRHPLEGWRRDLSIDRWRAGRSIGSEERLAA